MTSNAELSTLLADAQRREYFFAKLTTTKSLPRLVEAGFFKRAPKPAPSSSTPKGLIHPAWPEGAYLARMASEFPADVAPILRALDPQDNWNAIQLRMRAIENLPPNYAKDFVDLYQADAGTIDDEAAYGLATLANRLWPEYKSRALDLVGWALRVTSRESSFGPSTDFALSDYGISHLVSECLAKWGEDDPPLIQDFVIKALARLLRGEHANQQGERKFDSSYIWLEDIEKGDKYERPKGELVQLLLKILRSRRQSGTKLPDLTNQLDAAGGWSLFRRLRLILISDDLPTTQAQATKELMDPENFDDSTIRPDYVRLLRATSKHWTSDEADAFAELALGQYSGAEERASYDRYLGRKASDEEWRKSVARSVRDRIAPVNERLSPMWKKRFDSWVAELGEPDFVDNVFRHGPVIVGSAPDSEIDSAPFEQLPNLFASKEADQKDPEGFRFDNREERLYQRIHADFRKILEDPKRMDDFPWRVRSTVIRGVAGGIRDAKELEPTDFSRAVTFSLRAQALAAEYGKAELPGLQHEVSRHVQSILSTAIRGGIAKTAGVEGDITTLIDLGIATPYPYGPHTTDGNADHFSTGINSAGGTAIENLVNFCLARKQLGKDGPPEKLLEKAVASVANSDSLPNRAVLGRLVPWVEALDPKLAAAASDLLWGKTKVATDAWVSAWLAYVSYSDAYNAVGRLLKEHYLEAMRLGKAPDNWHERTGNHVACFVLREVFTAEDLERMLSKSSPEALRDLLRGLGWALPDDAAKFPAGMAERAQRLIGELAKRMLANPKLKEGTAAITEAVTSESLPLEWRIKTASMVLSAGVKIDYSPSLVQLVLAALRLGNSEAVTFGISGLRYLLRDARGTAHWQIKQHLPEIRSVLADNGLPSQIVKAVANELVAGGFLEFREMARN